MAIILRKLIVTEPTEVILGGDGPSIGRQVDEAIESAMREGKTLLSVSFELEEDEWHRAAQAYHNVNASRSVDHTAVQPRKR